MYGEITEESEILRTEFKMHTGGILLPKEWVKLETLLCGSL